MKLYSKADKVMEAGNHFKNMACPGNRTSNNIINCTLTAIVVMTSIVTNVVAQSAYIRNDELPGFYEISMLSNSNFSLHEDALSNFSFGKGINFLGLANKLDYPPVPAADGTIKHNYVIYVDTAYVNRGTGLQKPQYMLAVATYFADESSDANEAGEKNDKYVIGRYLFNATQYASLSAESFLNHNKVQVVLPMILDERYKLFDNYDRLTFEWAIHKGDSLYVLKGNSIIPHDPSQGWWTLTHDPYQIWLTLTKEYGEEGKSIDFQKLIEWCTVGTFEDYYYPEGSNTSMDGFDFENYKRTFKRFKDVAAYDDKHSIGLHAIIDLNDNTHKDWVFSFRAIDSDMETFAIESETQDRSMLNGTMIEPHFGGWIWIHDYGVPVIMRTYWSEDPFLTGSPFFSQSGSAFIMQKTEGPSVNNEIIKTVADAASSVIVMGGTGGVTIHNAAGRKVVISNMLGQVIVNSTVSSDMTTVSVPSGIVIVSVEGETSIKAVVQ